MSDVFQKFIIENDPEDGLYMVLAKCTFHKQLAHNTENVLGGGSWELFENEITLFGQSHDFGPCDLEDLKYVVQNQKVFTSSTLIRNLSDKFTFIWQDIDYGTKINLKE